MLLTEYDWKLPPKNSGGISNFSPPDLTPSIRDNVQPQIQSMALIFISVVAAWMFVNAFTK
jgi:hypothetical protein